MLTYEQRIPHCRHPLSKKLLTMMVEKQSNLSIAADVTTYGELMALIDATAPHICMLKTHLENIRDIWDHPDIFDQLQQKARDYHFLIFEDRKLADIGNTVVAQYSYGAFAIADWAHIVNAHILPGPGIIQGIHDANEQKGLVEERGLLLLAQMSSKDNLLTGEYTKQAVAWAEEYPDTVMGFISQEKLCDYDDNAPDFRAGFIHCTPGVKLQQGGDALGQQYNTPDYVIGAKGTDVIIVGRGIYQADDKAAAAKAYQQAGWDGYLGRC